MEHYRTALTFANTYGERLYEAELYRLKGELILASIDERGAQTESRRKAEVCFQNALGLARKQRAKSWELRAAMSLGRLWRHQGKMKEAYGVLAEVYHWFTEGFDTRDLQEAKTVLDNLAAKVPSLP